MLRSVAYSNTSRLNRRYGSLKCPSTVVCSLNALLCCGMPYSARAPWKVMSAPTDYASRMQGSRTCGPLGFESVLPLKYSLQ